VKETFEDTLVCVGLWRIVTVAFSLCTNILTYLPGTCTPKQLKTRYTSEVCHVLQPSSVVWYGIVVLDRTLDLW